MAYLKSIEHKCPCGKRATVEVFNNFNAPCGTYCKTCGERYVRELKARGA